MLVARCNALPHERRDFRRAVAGIRPTRRLIEVFAYLGWPSERLSEVVEDLSLVHQLVKGDDGTTPMTTRR